MNFLDQRDQIVMVLFEYYEYHNRLALLLLIWELHRRNAILKFHLKNSKLIDISQKKEQSKFIFDFNKTEDRFLKYSFIIT